MIRTLIKFIGARSKRVPSKTRDPRLHTKGEHFDLRLIYDQVNSKYFKNELDLKITWVGNRHSKPRTKVMFGSYSQQQKLIRIHRRLDQQHIPDFFISYIIYHEMLHHVLPPVEKTNRRRQIHHTAFVEREKNFREYSLAKAYGDEMKAKWFVQV